MQQYCGKHSKTMLWQQTNRLKQRRCLYASAYIYIQPARINRLIFAASQQPLSTSFFKLTEQQTGQLPGCEKIMYECIKTYLYIYIFLYFRLHLKIWPPSSSSFPAVILFFTFLRRLSASLKQDTSKISQPNKL